MALEATWVAGNLSFEISDLSFDISDVSFEILSPSFDILDNLIHTINWSQFSLFSPKYLLYNVKNCAELIRKSIFAYFVAGNLSF